MRRILAVGVVVALLGGGGYALASAGSGTTIHACVHRSGGGVYIGKKCAPHDGKLSWNTIGPRGLPGQRGPMGVTGPQGPGATSAVFNTTGSATPATVTIGHVGPYTFTGTCSNAGGNERFTVNMSGPGGIFDGLVMDGNNSSAYSQTIPGPITASNLATAGPTTNEAVVSAEFLVSPTGGVPFQTLLTAVAVGSSPPAGETANTCHASSTMIPTTASH